MSDKRSWVTDAALDARRVWKSLFLTGLIYKAIVVMMLMPLFGILFRFGLKASGQTVLADEDILWFVLGPMGWLTAIVLGAVWLGISASEQAALLAVVATAKRQRMTAIEALQFATSNAWAVVQVIGRMIAWSLLAITPSLILAAIAYHRLLSDYDINYYLRAKPTQFIVAIVIAAMIVLGLVGLFARWLTSWFFALPLVLFGDTRPSDALAASRDRARGHRLLVLAWLFGWLMLTLFISALATACMVKIGQVVLPGLTGSLTLLTIAMGVILLGWSLLELAINLLSSILLACVLLGVSRQLNVIPKQAAPVDTDSQQSRSRWLRLTTTRVLVACLIGLVGAVALGASAIYQLQQDDEVAVIAHRGASWAAPENTLAAIKLAIEEQADFVEIDVQETKDGEVVVFHDSDFMRTADVQMKIWNATLDALRNIDIGSWFSTEFQAERVPTLEQVLNACRDKASVVIELKYYDHDEQLEQRVLDVVDRCGMAEQVAYMSLKPDGVQKLKSLRPESRVGLLMSVSAGDLAKLNIDFVAVNARAASRSFIKAAHQRNMEVYVWTVNDVVTMSTMIGRGVDGVITDHPGKAAQVLAERREMGVAERLLVGLAAWVGVPPNITTQ